MRLNPFALAIDSSSVITIVMLVLVVVVFYFLLIRPQKKQEKAAQEMRDNMKVGDEVTTIGGIVGKIVSLKEETVVLETTKDKTHIRFLRAAIRSVDVVAEDSHPPKKEESLEETAGKKGRKGKKKPAIEPAAVVETPASKEAVAGEAPAEDAAQAETSGEDTISGIGDSAMQDLKKLTEEKEEDTPKE